MKKISLVLLMAVFAACASTDDDAPPPDRRPEGGRRMPMRAQAGALDLLPPANWWHDPQVAAAVHLNEQQFKSLDDLGNAHTAEIETLRGDARNAERDLRLMLDAEHPTADDLVAAGSKLRTLRDQITDHELRLLADERALLTREQWTSLQSALRDGRDDFRDRRGGYGGGRGGGRRGGGGGRRPW